MAKKKKKKETKINIPPSQKIQHTYCISCKKYTGNSHIDSKTINNINQSISVLSVSMIIKCFYNKLMGNI